MYVYRHDHIENDGERPDFTPSTTRHFGRADENDLCHSISYDLIRQVMDDAVLRNYDRPLSCLITMLSLPSLVPKNPFKYRAKLTDLQNDIRDNIKGKKIRAANELLTELNSAKCNLRLGNSRWNRSLHSIYDPVSWYYFDGNNIKSSHNNLSDPGYQWQILPTCDNDVGFYLDDEMDCMKLYMFINLVSSDRYKLEIAKGTEPRTSQPFLYSSSNQYELISNRLADENNDYVYYYYNGEWHVFSGSFDR